MAASSGKASGDQERLKANFDNAASEIKEDVVQLAAVWVGGLSWGSACTAEQYSVICKPPACSSCCLRAAQHVANAVKHAYHPVMRSQERSITCQRQG